MKYTITATIAGKKGTVTWEDGNLSGDPVLIELLRIYARIFESHGYKIGPPSGPYVSKNYLADALATYFLAEYAFVEVTFAGDVPAAPDAPEGWIR